MQDDFTPQDAPPVVDAPAPAEQPQTLHDAMWARDEMGRFAPRPADEPEDPPEGDAPPEGEAKPAEPAQPAQPKPEAAEDVTKMPEGLQPKAQERFQRLVSEVKQRDEQIEELRGAVTYVQETFQQHGVKQEQFEQAVGFIGAMNRGDYSSAEQMLLGQLRQLSLVTGKDYGGDVNPLAEFPDLNDKVSGLQVSREDAIEIARLRRQQAEQHQRQQTAQEQMQRTQADEQQFKAAQMDLDKWSRQMAAQDIDWPVIEQQLLPVLPDILRGVPVQSWQNVVQTQYKVLKNAAQAFRPKVGTTPSPLRATGAGSPAGKPASMYEAMFGGS